MTVTKADLQHAFSLYYRVWEGGKNLPEVAADLNLPSSKARKLLVDFATECALNSSLYSRYEDWKQNQGGQEVIPSAIFEEIRSKLRDTERLLQYAQPLSQEGLIS